MPLDEYFPAAGGARASPSPTLPPPLAGSAGVCMMNNKWKDEQHSSFINFISSFLTSNSFRLNIVPISPDFIFNCGGLSVAFIFVTNWDCENIEPFFSRVQKLKSQFANLYVVVCLPTKQHNDSFVHSYFKCGMVFGKPTFVPVQDREMGFEKMIKIALSRGACKRQDVTAKLKAEVSLWNLFSCLLILLTVIFAYPIVICLDCIVKKKQAVQGMDNFLKVVTSIKGIDNHDANALIQAIGSIEAIAQAPREYILENTDLSSEKVETITRFFRDPEYYLSPKIN